ncbi:LysM peptidoglycan-binding domain-containing protein [Lactococcus lactis]|nr:LysM peptidoglycan-binding domain-containing protein [Lactococcus lactis]
MPHHLAVALSLEQYTIVTGDYPSTIAAKTGIPWATIASLNGITEDGYNADGSAIHAGQVLKLK